MPCRSMRPSIAARAARELLLLAARQRRERRRRGRLCATRRRRRGLTALALERLGVRRGGARRQRRPARRVASRACLRSGLTERGDAAPQRALLGAQRAPAAARFRCGSPALIGRSPRFRHRDRRLGAARRRTFGCCSLAIRRRRAAAAAAACAPRLDRIELARHQHGELAGMADAPGDPAGEHRRRPNRGRRAPDRRSPSRCPARSSAGGTASAGLRRIDRQFGVDEERRAVDMQRLVDRDRAARRQRHALRAQRPRGRRRGRRCGRTRRSGSAAAAPWRRPDWPSIHSRMRSIDISSRGTSLRSIRMRPTGV